MYYVIYRSILITDPYNSIWIAAVVRAKFYRREPEGEVDEARAEQALNRVRDMFEKGPREKYSAPVTTSNESVV